MWSGFLCVSVMESLLNKRKNIPRPAISRRTQHSHCEICRMLLNGSGCGCFIGPVFAETQHRDSSFPKSNLPQAIIASGRDSGKGLSRGFPLHQSPAQRDAVWERGAAE